MTYLSIAEASELLRKKSVSSAELTKACLNRIEQLNPKLNALITISSESPLKEAATADIEIRNGNWKGRLHGIPIALKDNMIIRNDASSEKNRLLECGKIAHGRRSTVYRSFI